MRGAAICILLAAVSVSGCGSVRPAHGQAAPVKQASANADQTATSSKRNGARTSLTVTFYPHGQANAHARVWRLTCNPTGGSHPRRRAACRELADHIDLLGPATHPCTRAPGALLRRGLPEAYVAGRVGHRRIARLVRPACDATAWSNLHALLSGT